MARAGFLDPSQPGTPRGPGPLPSCCSSPTFGARFGPPANAACIVVSQRLPRSSPAASAPRVRYPNFRHTSGPPLLIRYRPFGLRGKVTWPLCSLRVTAAVASAPSPPDYPSCREKRGAPVKGVWQWTSSAITPRKSLAHLYGRRNSHEATGRGLSGECYKLHISSLLG